MDLYEALVIGSVILAIAVALVPVVIIIQLAAILSTLKKILRKLP